MSWNLVTCCGKWTVQTATENVITCSSVCSTTLERGSKNFLIQSLVTSIWMLRHSSAYVAKDGGNGYAPCRRSQLSWFVGSSSLTVAALMVKSRRSRMGEA